MRHQKNTKKLRRTPEERRRLKRDLSRGLILSGKIVTFTTRAKWFRPFFDRLVSLVKRAGDDTQLAFTHVRPYFDEKVSRVLIEEIVPRLQSRNSGYTSIIKVQSDYSTQDKALVRIMFDEVKAPKTSKAKEEIVTPELEDKSTNVTEVESKPKTLKPKVAKKVTSKAKKESKE
jgi:large subunit ribosomal protein L17